MADENTKIGMFSLNDNLRGKVAQGDKNTTDIAVLDSRLTTNEALDQNQDTDIFNLKNKTSRFTTNGNPNLKLTYVNQVSITEDNDITNKKFIDDKITPLETRVTGTEDVNNSQQIEIDTAQSDINNIQNGLKQAIDVILKPTTTLISSSPKPIPFQENVTFPEIINDDGDVVIPNEMKDGDYIRIMGGHFDLDKPSSLSYVAFNKTNNTIIGTTTTANGVSVLYIQHKRWKVVSDDTIINNGDINIRRGDIIQIIFTKTSGEDFAILNSGEIYLQYDSSGSGGSGGITSVDTDLVKTTAGVNGYPQNTSLTAVLNSIKTKDDTQTTDIQDIKNQITIVNQNQEQSPLMVIDTSLLPATGTGGKVTIFNLLSFCITLKPQSTWVIVPVEQSSGKWDSSLGNGFIEVIDNGTYTEFRYRSMSLIDINNPLSIITLSSFQQTVIWNTTISKGATVQSPITKFPFDAEYRSCQVTWRATDGSGSFVADGLITASTQVKTIGTDVWSGSTTANFFGGSMVFNSDGSVQNVGAGTPLLPGKIWEITRITFSK